MIADIVKTNLIPISKVCEKFGVKSLYLFGSATSDYFTPASDLDFIVDYFKDIDGLPLPPFDYFDILFSLESITGKKIDLVVKDAIRNSYFLKSSNETKVLLYENRN